MRSLLWVLLALVLLVTGLLAGLTWGPNLMRENIAARAGKMLGRGVNASHIDVSLVAGRVAVSDLVIDSLEPGKPMLTVKRTILEVNPWAYARGAVVVRSIDLESPRARLVRTAPDRLDLSDVIDEFINRPASLRRTDWQVDRISIHDGSIALDDRVVHKVTTLDKLELSVAGLTNKETDVQRPAEWQASFQLDGRPASIEGKATLFAESPEVTSRARIDALPVASVLPYLSLPADFKPIDGSLSLDLDARYAKLKKATPEALRLQGSANLKALRIQDAKGNDRLGAESIDVTLAPSFPLGGRIHLSRLALQAPAFDSGRDSVGRLVWPGAGQSTPAAVATTASSVVTTAGNPKAAAPDPVTGPRSLLIDSLSIESGHIHWQDAALPGALELNAQPLTLSAGPLEIADLNQPSHIQGKGRLDASINGESTFGADIELDGEQGKTTLALQKVPLARYASLVGPALKARVDQGWLTAKGDVQWNTATGSWSVQKANAELGDARISYPGRPPATIGLARMADLTVEPDAHRIKIGKFELDRATLVMQRNRAGRLDIQDWYVPTASAPTRADKGRQTASQPDWKLLVNQAEVKAFKLDYRDPLIASDNPLPKITLNLKARNLTLDPRQPVPFEADAALADGSALSASGQLRTTPLDLDARIRMQRLTLTYLDPYLEPFLNLSLSRGQLWGVGRLQLTSGPGGDLSRIAFDGELSVNGFDAVDKLSRDDFLRWSALAMPSVKVDWRPARVAESLIEIGPVAFVDFYARVILSPQGRLNLSEILIDRDRTTGPRSLTAAPTLTPMGRPATVAAPATPMPADVKPPGIDPTFGMQQPALPEKPGALRVETIESPRPRETAPMPIVRVGTVRIAGGNVNFTDLFIRPNYSANLTQLSGSIEAIASDRTEASNVVITGRVDDDTPLEIVGKINPLAPRNFIDLRAVATGFDLPKLSPYSGRWAGYAIEKGKLTADVRYTVEGDRLQAQNKLVINQLTFGDKVDSPDALKLPVRLAVSLLKDRDGNIDLDLPISGTLSDPQFSVGGLVWRAIGNLLLKVVTSPFTWLSSIGGASAGKDLSHIDFPAGQTTLSDESRTRLDGLAHGLEQRPGLSVEIAGYADPTSDALALQHAQLDRSLRSAKLGQLRRTNRASELPSIDEVSIDAGERPALLEQVWRAAKLGGPRPSAEQMEQQLLERTEVGKDAVSRMAQQRADAARDYLRDTRGVSNDRLFLLAPRLADAAEGEQGRRVAFEVK